MEFDPDWGFEDECPPEMFQDEPNEMEDPLMENKGYEMTEGDMMGIALGFGDFLSSERMKDLAELTAQTDEENIKKALQLCPVSQRHKSSNKRSSRPFEQFVDDLCSGKFSVNDPDY